MEKAARIVRIISVVIAVVLLAMLAAFVMARLRGLVCTLTGAVVLAYLLGKPLKKMEKRMKRVWALLILMGALAGAAALFFTYVVPLFVRQAADLMAYVPKVLQAAGSLLSEAGKNAGEPMDGIVSQALDGFNRRAAEWLGSATINVAQGSYSGLAWGLLLPVFTFYFLKDKEYFIDQAGYLIPIRYRGDLHALYTSIDRALSQFLRGQLVVALSVAVLTSAGLLAVGVPNALLLGLICGLCNLIPFIGPFLGVFPVALVSASLGPRAMLFAVLVVLLVQQLDNMIISPKIIGDSVRIHPVYVVAAIIAGSGLFGVMGLLLALPALIVLKEVVLFLFRKRLYKDRPAAKTPGT